MIKSVGIDLAGSGEHKVRCLDEQAQMCDGLTFQTRPEGLSKLEERIFSDGSNPVIVFEPTGLAWLIVAIYLKARHPDCHLYCYLFNKYWDVVKSLDITSFGNCLDGVERI